MKALNLLATLKLPNNIVADKNPVAISELKGNSTPYSFEVTLFALKSMCPYSTFVDISVSYNNQVIGKQSNKDTRCATNRHVELPFSFLCKFAPPLKAAQYKLQIQSNVEIPPVKDLFADLC